MAIDRAAAEYGEFKACVTLFSEHKKIAFPVRRSLTPRSSTGGIRLQQRHVPWYHFLSVQMNSMTWTFQLSTSRHLNVFNALVWGVAVLVCRLPLFPVVINPVSLWPRSLTVPFTGVFNCDRGSSQFCQRTLQHFSNNCFTSCQPWRPAMIKLTAGIWRRAVYYVQ